MTFIHGDIKSPNLFYDPSQDNEPYFIDWQHCAIGKGVQDLVFFIIESFDEQTMLSKCPSLKKYYFDCLKKHGIQEYGWEEFETDFWNAIYYIPFFTSIWFGTVPQDELIDPEFPHSFIKKLFLLIDVLGK